MGSLVKWKHLCSYNGLVADVGELSDVFCGWKRTPGNSEESMLCNSFSALREAIILIRVSGFYSVTSEGLSFF